MPVSSTVVPCEQRNKQIVLLKGLNKNYANVVFMTKKMLYIKGSSK